ncbi:hypothetical protein [Fibrobacter succinogenes]|uniref:Lipoprotein n=1 Tax=Fibrobacter succinogenes TaxID=833 RepID=A0A380S4Y2_FIBSU|nr:hypothetical protein [Fibrobacter succinogenes]PWJ35612.1 hypothetical protein IE02_1662 [Fibrobacter succinogenes subsp. elongatus]SUQ24267.1 hypothetical protein SAMN05661053_1662 [Fibrobacter succinogenes]
MQKLLIIFALSLFSVATELAHAQPPFDAAQVFEWWDDGIITAEEADEIFSRLEEENYDEACLLAEVYAQEPCIKPAQSKSAILTGSVQKVPTIVPHGNVSWKGQYDSEGHLKKHREELQLQFYYFRLRLGSQELLSYRRDNFEAYFGQVSTLEFHSHIPLDTLWGAALLYPIGKFRLGAFLDTSKTFNARVTFKPNRENEIGATFWKFSDAGAINVQARTTLGQISAWYQFGQDRPLVKIQLQSEKKHLSWKTTAYIHGDSLPLGLNLSKGIAENWLWASQTVNAKWPEALNTALSAKVRVLSPIASDSVSARFKMTLASGTAHLRPSLSVTCIEASNNCNTTEWNGTVESAWEPFSFKAGADLRYDRTNSAMPPKIELGASYRSSHALAKLSVAFPKTNPSKGFSVQNEVKLDNDWLNCNFVFAFKKTKSQSFKPNFAHILTTLKF